MKAVNNQRIYFLPAFIWALVILLLSGGKGVQMPSSWLDFISLDKFGHFVAYALLTFLILFGLLKTNVEIKKNHRYSSFLISSAYGILMEIMQYLFFPNRYFEVQDIIANIIGSFIGISFFKYIILKPR